MTATLLPALPWLAVGAALGAAYFLSLRLNVTLMLQPGRHLPALALSVLRIVVAVGVFLLIARLGAAPLIAAALGFLAARFAIVRRPATVAVAER